MYKGCIQGISTCPSDFGGSHCLAGWTPGLGLLPPLTLTKFLSAHPHIFLRPDLFEWPSPPSALPEPKSGGCPPLNTRGSRSQIRCHPGVTFSLTDFFANPFKHPSNASSYRQRGGGNLENETASTSSIVPVDIHYASREKRTLFQTPEITLISSAQRLAASAVKIKTKKEKWKLKKNKRGKRGDNFD